MDLLTKYEQQAYQYALNTYCIPERDNEKVSMNELYDWIVGTSSGSVAAAMLVQTNDDGTAKYYASDVRQLIADQGESLFVVAGLNFWTELGAGVAFVLLFGALGLCLGYKCHRDSTYKQYRDDLEQYLTITEKLEADQLEESV